MAAKLLHRDTSWSRLARQTDPAVIAIERDALIRTVARGLVIAGQDGQEVPPKVATLGHREGIAPLLTEAELLNRPVPPMLVDDLLIAGVVALLVSKPGMGKSFTALDLALSIAAGRKEVFGLPLRSHGPVVYVIGEGAGRFKLRVMAWKQHHEVTRSLPFCWNNGPINLLDDNAVTQFIAVIQRIQPRLIVIDTLSRCMVGKDENNQAVMTEVVANLDKIRESVEGLTVLVLHHFNASGSRERGSSVLNGAIDTQIELSHPSRQKQNADDDGEDDTRLLLTLTKQKDLDDEGHPLKLHKIVIAINGVTEHEGKPATSLVWASVQKIDLVTYVHDNPGQSKNKIHRELGGNRQALFARIDDHVKRGLLKIQIKGNINLVYSAP